MKEFDYHVPSYELSELNTLTDIIKFYSIPRQPLTPEEQLANADLPENLFIRLEPARFTAETSDFFGGKTAFPERDTVVTSLKYRDIYKGYENPKKYKRKAGFIYSWFLKRIYNLCF